MSKEEVKNKAIEKWEQAKWHVSNHPTAYIATAVGLISFGAGALVCGTDLIQVVDSFKIQWKTTTVNEITNALVRRGHPGNKVLCNETGVELASQNHMAEVMGLDPSALGKHLNGRSPHVKGFTFKRTGEAQAA